MEDNQTVQTATKVTSAEQFITTSPLFTEVSVNGFYPPQQISFECPGECSKETTWELVYKPACLGNSGDRTVPDWNMNAVAYRCFLCKKSVLTVIYKETEKEKRSVTVTTKVMKIGQYPAPTLTVPKGLKKSLGEDAATLYRKALLNRNNGFGLGAVSYMRRVVEDKTNELIEVAAKHAESYFVDVETVAKMRTAADSSSKYTTYKEKLEYAGAVFPDSLKVGGINPLLTLHRLVSKGLHGLSESECLDIADEIKAVFEYVFENLQAQLDSRKAFTEKMKRLTLSEPNTTK